MMNHFRVFVFGAGASVDQGFPLGSELRAQIIRQLRDPGTGMWPTLHRLGHAEAAISDFAREFTDARVSIDTFLLHRPEYLVIAKQCIAAVLLPLERPKMLRAKAIESTCYGHLFQRLVQYELLKDDRIKFITFNYERSLTQVLIDGLLAVYGSRLKSNQSPPFDFPAPLHVYGSLGPLSIEQGSDQLPYGADETPENIARAADHICPIHERNGAVSEQLESARWYLERAEMVVFLGFAFAAEYVQALRLRNGTTLYFGSGYHMARGERRAAGLQISDDQRLRLGAGGLNAVDYLRSAPVFSALLSAYAPERPLLSWGRRAV